MDLKNRKELSKLIKYLRKNGVSSIKSGDFEIHLSNEAPKQSAYKQKKLEKQNTEIQIETPFTDEDVLFWSSAGIPEVANG